MDDEDANLSADGEAQQRAKRRRVSRDEDLEGPACQSCRRKKAKCTRQQPCSVCVKYRTASAASAEALSLTRNRYAVRLR